MIFVIAFLCIFGQVNAGGSAELVPALDYGYTSYGGYGSPALAYGGYGSSALAYGGYGSPALASYPYLSQMGGVLGDGSYIPGAGFIPGYPFTYMRDSYAGHLPPGEVYATSVYSAPITKAASLYKAAPLVKSAPLRKAAAIAAAPVYADYAPLYSNAIAGYGYNYDKPLALPAYGSYSYKR